VIRRIAVIAISLIAAGADTASGQWINPAGRGWVSVDLYYDDTMSQFGEEANEEPLPEEGHSITTSVYSTMSVGLFTGIDAWAQIPVIRSQFSDIAGDRQSTGFGDPRFYLRIGPSLFGINTTIPIDIRTGIKLVGSDFAVDAETIPISDGQRDYELMVELGHSFWPRPIYVSGWVGYRWRGTNKEIDRKPGNEWFGFVKAGGNEGRLIWMVDVEGFKGSAPESFGIEIVTARRELVQVTPRLGVVTGMGSFLVGARLAVLGRNYPSGTALIISFFRTQTFWN